MFVFSAMITVSAVFLIAKLKCRADHKRWLYGLPPAEELPNRNDIIPAPVQLLFMAPGLICFLLLSLIQLHEFKFIIKILRFIWGG
jgi:hypothetical protein